MQTEALDSLDTNGLDSSDVLMESIVEEPTHAPVVSIFEDHLLQPTDGINPLLIDLEPSWLVFAVFSICTILIIYLQQNSDGIFSSIIKGSFDMNLTIQESRVDNSQRSRNMILVQLLSALAISLFVIGSVGHFSSSELSQAELFITVFVGLITFILFKKGIEWILASLFQVSGILKGYHFSSNILMASSGLAILPVCLLLFYSTQIPSAIPVYTCLFIISFFYMKSMLRGIQMALTGNSVSPLHLFYYLCALEILPVFVLIRFALIG